MNNIAQYDWALHPFTASSMPFCRFFAIAFYSHTDAAAFACEVILPGCHSWHSARVSQEPMLSLYLPFHVLQGLAQYHLALRSRSRKTKYAVSSDLTLLSCIWSSAHMLATCLYAYSSGVRADYAERYPLYPDIQLSKALPLAHAFQVVFSISGVRRIFCDPKRKESVSVVCMILVSVYGVVLTMFCWLYCRGKARIKLLDIADMLHIVGSVSWAVRLIPQVSVDWFQECVPHLNIFVYVQATSLIYGSVCNFVVDRQVLWYDQPVDKPVNLSLGLAFLCSCCLMHQSHVYKIRTPQLGREVPERNGR